MILVTLLTAASAGPRHKLVIHYRNFRHAEIFVNQSTLENVAALGGAAGEPAVGEQGIDVLLCVMIDCISTESAGSYVQ